MINKAKKQFSIKVFYSKAEEKYNHMGINLRQSILLSLSFILVYRIILILKIFNDNKFNLGGTYIFFYGKRNCFLFYSILIILIECFRNKSKSLNIFNDIFYKMIIGKQRIFNWVLYSSFLILYSMKYYFFVDFISDGYINIINTFQTLIVTFFISINFSEGYFLYTKKVLWEKNKSIFLSELYDILYHLNKSFKKIFKHCVYYQEEVDKTDKIFEKININKDYPFKDINEKEITVIINCYKNYVKIVEEITQSTDLYELIPIDSEKGCIEELISYKDGFSEILNFVFKFDYASDEFIALHLIKKNFVYLEKFLTNNIQEEKDEIPKLTYYNNLMDLMKSLSDFKITK